MDLRDQEMRADAASSSMTPWKLPARKQWRQSRNASLKLRRRFCAELLAPALRRCACRRAWRQPRFHRCPLGLLFRSRISQEEEKEQIAFAVRLALARELARSERQLLVLDDSLTTTDPARFERILDILKESADRLQILILTCDPRRYEALSKARRHDLDRAIGERPTRRAA